MIYKNNLANEKKFLKKYYLTVGIPILIALSIYSLMANYVFDSREDLAESKWILYFSLSITALFAIATALICGKKHKRNYEKYELEISETELISRTGNFQKVIKINELAKIDTSKKGVILVYDAKGNSILIKDWLEGFAEIRNILSSQEIDEENVKSLKKYKAVKILKNPSFILYLIIFLMIILKVILILR